MLADTFDSFCQDGFGAFFQSPYGERDCPGGELVVGGRFLMAGDKTVKLSARTDGTDSNDAWIPVGDELSGGTPLKVTDYAEFQGDLYCVGEFDLPSPGIAKYNKADDIWEAVGAGLGGAGVGEGLYVYGDLLIVAGLFTESGNSNVVAWDGEAFSAFGTLTHKTFDILEFQDELYIFGEFILGPGPVLGMGKWDGISSWVALPGTGGAGTSGLIGFTASIYTAEIFEDKLYMGGLLTSFINGATIGSANNILSWDGTILAGVDMSGASGGLNLACQDLCVFKEKLTLVGAFTTVGVSSTTANRIATYDGTTLDDFESTTGANANLNSCFVFQDEIYFTGNATTFNSVSASFIAKWNDTDLDFEPLGDGLDDWGETLNEYEF